jgi:hypothetical protein
MFHQQLVSQSPFRAIAAIPLPEQLSGIGTVDLYLKRSQDLAALVIPDVNAVTAEITRILWHNRAPHDPELGPPWANGPAAPAGTRWRSPSACSPCPCVSSLKTR